MQGYRDLVAWQKSMELVKQIYLTTAKFPKSEVFGLAQQLRRAAVSIPSNLAEGQGRTSPREMHQFVANARGSLLELETQVIIAADLGFVDEATGGTELLARTHQIGRMLNGLLEWSKARGRMRSH